MEFLRISLVFVEISLIFSVFSALFPILSALELKKNGGQAHYFRKNMPNFAVHSSDDHL